MASRIELSLPRGESEIPEIAELGLALVDGAFHPIAMDEGAASILSALSSAYAGGDCASGLQKLPPVILDQIRKTGRKEAGLNEAHFVAANHCYSARACPIRSHNSTDPGPWLLLRFERDFETSEALAELSTTCGLTDRESEALSAIAVGLTSKEIAYRMKISPSTVKVFLRLIKIKTGTRNRADLVARLLERRHRVGAQSPRGARYQAAQRRPAATEFRAGAANVALGRATPAVRVS